jgi:hypothetical protein
MAHAPPKIRTPALGVAEAEAELGNNFMNFRSSAAASEELVSTLSRFLKTKTQRRNPPLDAGNSGNFAEVSDNLISTIRRLGAIPPFGELKPETKIPARGGSGGAYARTTETFLAH